jgi:shikimate kinase/3-dehydroquinate synthase
MRSFPPADRVVLVGFMGAGKSSVGRALAHHVGFRFLDLDERVEASTGLSIAALFERRGEEAFREEERAAARSLLEEHRLVIAAGGGAFAQPLTREVLAQGAVTVWLRCPLDVLLSRLPSDGKRPLLASREIMQELFDRREPCYALADVAVDASAGSPAEVAHRIADVLRGRGIGKGNRTAGR